MDAMERERDIDQWLESELSQYGKAEPREGLESRVLANLQTERNRITSARRWWWPAGTAAALAVVVAALWVGESVHGGNRRSRTGTLTIPREEAQRIQPMPAIPVTHPATEVAKRRPAQRTVRDLAAAQTPKLEQFPSRQPLSEQERILASYVANYPEHAALVAQAWAEALRQDREEEAAEAATGRVQ